MGLPSDPQQMTESENTVYEAIGTFGAGGRQPTRAEIAEAIGVPEELVDPPLHKLIELGFVRVASDNGPRYGLVGGPTGPPGLSDAVPPPAG